MTQSFISTPLYAPPLLRAICISYRNIPDAHFVYAAPYILVNCFKSILFYFINLITIVFKIEVFAKANI